MYVTNLKRHGHLVSADHFETTHTVNDLFNIFENPYVSRPGVGVVYDVLTAVLCDHDTIVYP